MFIVPYVISIAALVSSFQTCNEYANWVIEDLQRDFPKNVDPGPPPPPPPQR